MIWALKNIGLVILGMCLLSSAVMVNDTYTAFIEHEKSRETNIHIAYSNILNKLENVQQASIALPPSAVLPMETIKELPVPQTGKGKK